MLRTDLTSIPRPRAKKFYLPNRAESPWQFPKSIFAPYKNDTESILNQCFEFDFKNTKLPKITKDDQDLDLLKTFLKSRYKIIREIYKLYAGVQTTNGVLSIGQNTFTEIVYSCPDLLDGKQLNLSDVDLEFVSTNAGQRGKLNPERALVRH